MACEPVHNKHVSRCVDCLVMPMRYVRRQHPLYQRERPAKTTTVRPDRSVFAQGAGVSSWSPPARRRRNENMAALGDGGGYHSVGKWVDALAVAVSSSAGEMDEPPFGYARHESDLKSRPLAMLEDVATREQVASRIISSICHLTSPLRTGEALSDKAEVLLSACRVLMRDRRGIDSLLTTEALDQFLAVAESENASWGARGEALKCAINSVYSRPEFVATMLSCGDTKRDAFIPRLLKLVGLQAPASWLALVWKALLVSCDCSAMAQVLSQSFDAWSLLYTTISYVVYDSEQQRSHAGTDDSMLIEMLKLVAVLVNEVKWSDGDAAASAEVLRTIHRLGELLLFIMGSDASINVKNLVAEVFMFLPPALTAAFVDQQRDDNPLDAVLDHLEAMLVAVRVEKTSSVETMLPILILCHNLTLAGNPSTIAAFFRAAVLPPESVPVSRQARRAVFLFTHLQFFLTCLDTDVRRFAGEWLYLLCDQNAEEYTRRTGIGKAIGMLRVKGLA